MAGVGKYTISVEPDELNTILAALRYYQQSGMGEPSNRPDWLQEIACPDDDATSLSDSEIDRLCEEINCSPGEPVPTGVVIGSRWRWNIPDGSQFTVVEDVDGEHVRIKFPRKYKGATFPQRWSFITAQATRIDG